VSYRAVTLASFSAMVGLTSSSAAAQTSIAAADRVVSRLGSDDIRLVRAHRATTAIVLDGRIDDVAWRSAERAADFVQQRPTPGAPASERTEVRVLFDAGALYVSMTTPTLFSRR
jgi:hypothetical protein